ncbi:hypothetical protein R6Q59_022810 [Mikania micrantha]
MSAAEVVLDIEGEGTLHMDNTWFTKLTNAGFAFIAIVISSLVNTNLDASYNSQTFGYMRYLTTVGFVSFLTAKVKLGRHLEAVAIGIGLLMINMLVIIALLPKDLAGSF